MLKMSMKQTIFKNLIVWGLRYKMKGKKQSIEIHSTVSSFCMKEIKCDEILVKEDTGGISQRWIIQDQRYFNNLKCDFLKKNL